jgi:hypothetical protein
MIKLQVPLLQLALLKTLPIRLFSMRLLRKLRLTLPSLVLLSLPKALF